ncbi:hypothetical protein [Paenibacillus piri]|uniref:Uncharacterized protein n=1 Tax=Paenibacillus piri TaxID=2547395 RepID=A0A4R5KCP7_9BACL|nr:hypothetical protein [Paenibacillus piri]TDF92953.1 hypothetical protein E1757_28145 [Paenibacillus piri]
MGERMYSSVKEGSSMVKLVRAVLLLFITIQILSACSKDTTATTKSIKYENEKYKFFLTLPSKWRDKTELVK